MATPLDGARPRVAPARALGKAGAPKKPDAPDAEAPDPETAYPYAIGRVGAWGGPVHAFVRVGDLGFVGSGQRVVVLDVRDLSDIVEIGAVALGSTVRDLAVRDGFIYAVTNTVASGSMVVPPDAGLALSGVHVIDARVPTAPQIVWSNDPSETGFFFGREIDLHADLAYLRGQNQFRSLDISNPLQPEMLSERVRFVDKRGDIVHQLNEVVIQGDLMFTITDSDVSSPADLNIYDISGVSRTDTPLAPTLVSSVGFFAFRTTDSLAVDGSRAYVGTRDYFTQLGDPVRKIVHEVDVSDPAQPVKTDAFDAFVFANPTAPHRFGAMVATGGRLYIADGATEPATGSWDLAPGLIVLDTSGGPGTMRQLGTYRTHGSVWGVAADGGDPGVVYLLDEGEGLIALDVANPAAPVQLGGYHSPALLRAIARRGDHLYVTDMWNGFTILDVSDPASPSVAGVYQSTERLGINHWGIAVDGDGIAYLGAGSAGLELVDVSDPAVPRLVAAARLPSGASYAAGVHVSEPGTLRNGGGPIGYAEYAGKVAYLAVKFPIGSAVFSLDVTEPSAIAQLDPDGVIISGLPRRFEALPNGRVLYAGGVDSFGAIVECRLPVRLGTAGLSDRVRLGTLAIDAADEMLYASNGNGASRGGGLHVYDYGADPLQPTKVGVVPMGRAGALDVHPAGVAVIATAPDLLGASMGGNRVVLLDASDPAEAQVLGTALVPNQVSASGSEAHGDLVVSGDRIYVTASDRSTPERSAGLVVYGVTALADRNADGVANVLDVLAFIDDVRERRDGADLNGDGSVDGADVLRFLELWRRSR